MIRKTVPEFRYEDRLSEKLESSVEMKLDSGAT